VTDQQNHTVRKLAPGTGGWTVSTVGGAPGQRGTADGVGDAARFNKPWGIAVDDAGTLFVADYLNHTIRMGISSAPPPPALRVARGTNQLVLSWPSVAPGYVLETAGVLGRGASWAPLTNGIAVSGNRSFYTNAIGSSPAFFRLRKGN